LAIDPSTFVRPQSIRQSLELEDLVARILVVDDDASVRVLVRTILEAEGHSIIEAVNGLDALKKLIRRPADLVLLDIMMPKVDGIQVLKRLQTLPSRRHIPVIVITALHDPEQVQSEVEVGAIDHIAKPFDASVLTWAVERALRSGARAVEDHRAMLSRAAEVYDAVGRLRQRVLELDVPMTEITIDVVPEPRRRWRAAQN
jgi:CheY-like chemotaxis protein